MPAAVCSPDRICRDSSPRGSDRFAAQIGERVDHYRILDFIGEGGMGQVFRAEDLRSGADVALKFLPVEVCADPDLRKRLQTEAEIAATVRHPNVIHTFTPGNHQNCLYIAMEFVAGGTLADQIGREHLSLSRALDIALQLSRGLGAIHDAHIIHRDLKPANILIDGSGQVKITDLGLAISRHHRDNGDAPATPGTLAYTSPEQIYGHDLDHRSDLFSLGVLFYEMFTGRRPFDSEYAQVIPYAIINDDPQPLADHRPDLPIGLQAIIERLLAKQPEDRYSSAAQLISDLERL